MGKKTISKKFDAAKQMPPLQHVVPGCAYDVRQSEVAKWLLDQKDIMQYVFDKVASSTNGLNLIVYDPHSRKWQGIDYDD